MNATDRTLRAGEVLFSEGEPSKSMFLIHKGTVAIRKRRQGRFVELAKLHSNEVLGELSFFDRQPRSASAVAITEVELVEIPFDGLEQIWQKIPPYLKTIMSSVAERLRRADETIRRLQTETIDDHGTLRSDGEVDAASVLAATADAPDGAGKGSPEGG